MISVRVLFVHVFWFAPHVLALELLSPRLLTDRESKHVKLRIKTITLRIYVPSARTLPCVKRRGRQRHGGLNALREKDDVSAHHTCVCIDERCVTRWVIRVIKFVGVLAFTLIFIVTHCSIK